MGKQRAVDYVAFEREKIPESALVAEWRTGQQPSAWVDTSRINVFRQVRGEIPRDDLADLVPSLQVDDKISIIQPPTIGLFGLNAAKRYIGDLNNCWSTDYSLAECNTLPRTSAFTLGAVIAGHRRTKASIVLAQKLTGEKNPELWIPVQYQVDPLFFEGLRTQYQENSHRSVPLWQDADAIAATVRWGRSNGTLPTYTAVASYLGISSERVSKAISFDALPEQIKHRVKEGSLTQENAIFLERIGSALGFRYLSKILGEDDETIVAMKTKVFGRQLRVDELRPELAKHNLLVVWEATLHAELTRLLAKETKSRYVTSRTNELTGSGALFDLDDGIAASHTAELLKTRRVIQGESLAALRILMSAFTADAHRIRYSIEHPGVSTSSLMDTPVIANSPQSRNTWLAMVEQMEIITKMEANDSAILGALENVCGGLALLYSEASLERVVSSRASELDSLINQFRNIFEFGGGSLEGVGKELVEALRVLQAVLKPAEVTAQELF